MADVDIIGEVTASIQDPIEIEQPSTLKTPSSSSDLLEFRCDDIENFLNFFQPVVDTVVKMESDACAIPPDASSSLPLSPSTDDCLSPATNAVSSIKDPSLTSIVRQFELPKSITVFNRRIFTACNQHKKNIEIFEGKPKIDISEIQASRFPPELISCYSEDVSPPTPDGSTMALSDSNEPDVETKADAPATQSKGRRKRRKQRLSLLEVKKFYFENGKERELLLPNELDLKTAYSKVHPGRDIPFVYQCNDGEEHDCALKCAKSAHNFKLYMSVNPNNGTLPPPIVTENILSNLRENEIVVDKTSALIATTALRAKNQPNFRIFLPVSDNLLKRISVARDIQIGPVLDVKLEIDDAVRTVVDEMVEFVDRQSNAMEPDHDPDYHESSFDSSINDDSTYLSHSNLENLDGPSKTSTPETGDRRSNRRPRKTDRVIRELKKLANISVTDESSAVGAVKKSENCTELFCKLGCVCDTLTIKPPPPDHCGNSECIFGCICGEKPRYVYVPIEELAKNEKTWHQTVIRKADNCVEIQSGIARSKRAKKAPERFDDWNPGSGRGSRAKKKTDMGEEEKKPVANKKSELPDFKVSKGMKHQRRNLFKGHDVHRHQNKVSKLLEIIKSKAELGEVSELDKRTIKKLSLAKKLVYCRSAGKSAKSLADVFIYCSIHNVYDCECDGWIVMMKNGDMLLKSAFKQSQIVEEALKTISLSNTTSFRKKAMVYDLARHSARTAAPVIDYVKRNKSKVFRKKSSVALEYGVTSYTNSYVKVPPVPLVSYCEDEAKGSNPSFLGTDAVDSGVGRVVKLSTKVSSETEKCRVVDDQKANVSPTPANNLQEQEDSDSEELPEGKFTIVELPQKRQRVGSKPGSNQSSSVSSSKAAKPKSVHHKLIKDGAVIDLSREESPDERQINSIVISDDDEEKLPDFGLFCQSHPHLGYVGLEDRGDGFFGVRGFSEQIDKFSFSDIKQACEFLRQILDHTGDPKFADSKWIKVTKGVLELKKCKKFVPTKFLRPDSHSPLPKKKTGRFRKIYGTPPPSPPSPESDHGLPSVDLTDEDSSTEKPAMVRSTTQTSQIVSAGVMPVLVTKTTFPTMDEAKAYIQKNFGALSTPEQLPQQQQPLNQQQPMKQQPLLSVQQQRLVVPVGSTCIIRSANPRQPLQRIVPIPGAGTSAPQSLRAAVVLPSVTQTATSVAKTSASIVATPKTPSSAVVTFRGQPVPKPTQSSEPPRSADVILPLNDRTIKILSPQPKKILNVKPAPDKKTPVAYLYDKKQLPSSPVKSLLAKRKLDDR